VFLKQSPKLPAETRKSQLIKAAAKVFARKGFDGATTEDISTEAGVTKGALYFHFKSKEDIFLAVVKDHTDYQIEKLFQILERDADLERVVDNCIRTSFQLMLKDKRFSFDFWQHASKIPRVRKYMSGVHELAVEKFSDFIRGRSNLKKNEAEALVWLVHAVQDGLLVQMQCYTGGRNQKDIINQIIIMCKLYLRERGRSEGLIRLLPDKN